MTAPTEAEIREAVERAIDESSIDIGTWVYDIASPLSYVPPGERGPGYDTHPHLWDDLRPSQGHVLAGIREAIYAEIQPLEVEVIDKIREAVVKAALAFAMIEPDAPRAAREAVTA